MNRNQPLRLRILGVSHFAKNHKLFSDIVSTIYKLADKFCGVYPNFFIWYWSKTIPELLQGKREIFIVLIGYNIVGVAILKKGEDEKKICTLFVVDKYRGNGIGTRLLQKSFKYLGTTQPLISIPEYKLQQFDSIIQKYAWKKTQILDYGHYNCLSREIVFNGRIS